MSWKHRENWRWDPDLHVRRTPPTIVVSESSDEAKREHQDKIDAGAEVVPFGFARALPRDEESPVVVTDDDDAWEGQGL